MSAHVDKMDLKIAFNRMFEQLEKASTGERYPDVHAAITLLIQQIEAAGTAIEIAEQQHRIDRADYDRVRAEQRLAELEQ